MDTSIFLINGRTAAPDSRRLSNRMAAWGSTFAWRVWKRSGLVTVAKAVQHCEQADKVDLSSCRKVTMWNMISGGTVVVISSDCVRDAGRR